MLILASLVFRLHCVLLRNKAGVYCLPFVCVGFGGKRVIYSTFFQAAFGLTTAYPIGSLKAVYSPSACSHQMQFGFHQPVVVRMFVECEAEF